MTGCSFGNRLYCWAFLIATVPSLLSPNLSSYNSCPILLSAFQKIQSTSSSLPFPWLSVGCLSPLTFLQTVHSRVLSPLHDFWTSSHHSRHPLLGTLVSEVALQDETPRKSASPWKSVHKEGSLSVYLCVPSPCTAASTQRMLNKCLLNEGTSSFPCWLFLCL